MHASRTNSHKNEHILHYRRQQRSFCTPFAGPGRYVVSIGHAFEDHPMGPFPHDAPPATISADNPAGTDGFEFVEFAHPEPAQLEALFARMGYVEVARHKARDISLYRQGDINYVI